MPVVGQLNLNKVSAFGASGAISFEDCIWARASTLGCFKNESSSLISGCPRRTTSVAEVYHTPQREGWVMDLIRMRGE